MKGVTQSRYTHKHTTYICTVLQLGFVIVL